MDSALAGCVTVTRKTAMAIFYAAYRGHGQPLAPVNSRAVSIIVREGGMLSVTGAGLLQNNPYFIRMPKESRRNMSLRDITREIAGGFWFVRALQGCGQNFRKDLCDSL